jgi:sugar fermentation stimulation protein A
LLRARFIRRFKRFFAEMVLPNGESILAHCANTGSMSSCLLPGAECLISRVENPRAKLGYRWQAIRMPDGWVGINTSLANRLVGEALQGKLLPGLKGYSHAKAEAKVSAKSRLDWLLTGEGMAPLWIEVKNVSLLLAPGVVGFPDTATKRGQKHLLEMGELLRRGERAMLCFCVQRQSARIFVPAEQEDPEYASTLRLLVGAGLELWALHCPPDEEGVRPLGLLRVQLA